MKIGYISNLFLSDDLNKINTKIDSLVEESKQRELSFLVCCGGISHNYHTTLNFTNTLGKRLKGYHIGFRFIVGNTDFYYPESESVVSKESKMREILVLYSTSPYYLPNSPINTRNTRISGFESWYDYTLYRGKPKELKNITKKSIGFFKNLDVKYLTDRYDYMSGVKETFDVRYCKETQARMISKLDLAQHRLGDSLVHNVCVLWFVPSTSFLGSSVFEKYFGTFKGSINYLNIMGEYKITDCVLGIKCGKHYPKHYHGIKFYNPGEVIHEVNYEKS